MRYLFILVLSFVCVARSSAAIAQDASTPDQEKFANIEKTLPDDPAERFAKLPEIAKAAFNASEYDKAQQYADELLALALANPKSWNYGNAIYDANMVNGRVALKRDGNQSAAVSYLLASVKTPGSPQLNSFGPNMSLARDLLEAGERDAVLDFFDQCRRFWKMDNGKLDKWIADVRTGQTPEFGANLLY